MRSDESCHITLSMDVEGVNAAEIELAENKRFVAGARFT